MMTRITSCGPITGVPARAPGVTAYKGIRYAAAGRWEYPRQVTHWEGVYQADHFGPCAIQNSTFTPESQSGRDPFYYYEFRENIPYTYSEDCQYLNIWAPDHAEKAPVIVYIHGGAFLSGSGWDKAFDEPAWPRKGVIAVTLNYRLGPLGYACLPELAAEAGHTGNYGLYDQLCALQWVHDNIAAFGGDPGNITVMGQSAGARSVQMLCSTEAACGLISKAVMSSGGGDDSVLFQGDYRMACQYDFWQDWQRAAGAADLAGLRALPVRAIYDALGRCFERRGFTATAKRSESIPGAIIAGCDMLLFVNDVEEDIQYLKAAYDKGELTEERLSDALHRILGLKAHLHLYEESVRIPAKSGLDCIGCAEHQAYSAQAADRCITLVKDTRGNLPVNPAGKKRVFLVYVGSTPTTKGYKGDPVKQVVVEELEKAGFEVDLCPNFHALEIENGVSPMNFVKMLSHSSREEFIQTHDWALIVINVKGYAQENNVRVRWSCNHSMELPWYNEEIPTVAMSLNYTNHLIDLPQVHTFINAYAPKRDHIQAAIQKITGRSAFKGTADENVFCDRWDTRL